MEKIPLPIYKKQNSEIQLMIIYDKVIICILLFNSIIDLFENYLSKFRRNVDLAIR